MEKNRLVQQGREDLWSGWVKTMLGFPHFHNSVLVAEKPTYFYVLLPRVEMDIGDRCGAGAGWCILMSRRMGQGDALDRLSLWCLY